MRFDPAAYGPEVEAILDLDSRGRRLMPLAGGVCSNPAARTALERTSATGLFAGCRRPEAAFAGLWLYFSCLEESHRLSQEIQSAEGSFWHGIMHRQEPDPGNAAYWFSRVGRHPVFPALAEEAGALGYAAGETWDPFGFIEYCEQARKRPASPEEKIALEVQRAEWQILFDYCAQR